MAEPVRAGRPGDQSDLADTITAAIQAATPAYVGRPNELAYLVEFIVVAVSARLAAKDAEVERLRPLAERWTAKLCGEDDVLRALVSSVPEADGQMSVVDRVRAALEATTERANTARGERDSARVEVAKLRELLGSIWLYVSWRYVTKQLTTEQKELWADAVEEWQRGINGGADPDSGEVGVDRWWRPDPERRRDAETLAGLHSLVTGVPITPDEADEWLNRGGSGVPSGGGTERRCGEDDGDRVPCNAVLDDGFCPDHGGVGSGRSSGGDQ